MKTSKKELKFFRFLHTDPGQYILTYIAGSTMEEFNTTDIVYCIYLSRIILHYYQVKDVWLMGHFI